LIAGGIPVDDAEQRRFAMLLARLEAEGAAGGFGYEQLRRRLVIFFRAREPVDADALADTALDRVARRLDEGTSIDNLALYALGVARLMLLEVQARNVRRDVALRDPVLLGDGEESEDETDAATLAALRGCLHALGHRGADLLLAYYGDDDSRRIKTRHALAERLRISANTLRNRVLRLRASLEACVRDRLGLDTRRDGMTKKYTSGHD